MNGESGMRNRISNKEQGISNSEEIASIFIIPCSLFDILLPLQHSNFKISSAPNYKAGTRIPHIKHLCSLRKSS
jgi:hypothetical protein